MPTSLVAFASMWSITLRSCHPANPPRVGLLSMSACVPLGASDECRFSNVIPRVVSRLSRYRRGGPDTVASRARVSINSAISGSTTPTRSSNKSSAGSRSNSSCAQRQSRSVLSVRWAYAMTPSVRHRLPRKAGMTVIAWTGTSQVCQREPCHLLTRLGAPRCMHRTFSSKAGCSTVRLVPSKQRSVAPARFLVTIGGGMRAYQRAGDSRCITIASFPTRAA